MLNQNASYVHSKYFLKGNEVDHIKQIGGAKVTQETINHLLLTYSQIYNRKKIAL